MKPTETSTDCTATSDKENMQEQPKVESGAATSTSVDESDGLGEANKLICSGNKHMVLGDYPSAVNAFQEACQLLGTKYGETSDKCAEAYFLYGKALLELARMENGVLGNALEGVDMEDEADSSTPAENAQAENTDDLDDDEDEDAEEGAAEDKENEEEVGNLQLAWEMLDLAQVIYKRSSSKESQLCAAQAHLKLGEIGIESGNYTQAIGDYLECLKIQQQHLDACNRLLAESNYQLGLAYNYNSQYKEAVEHFTKSLDIIEKRLAMVSARVEKEGSEDDKTEIEDLKGLLPDIKEKIEDAKECMKSGPAAELALKQTLGSDSTSFPQQNGSSSAQASTISVRKAPEGTTSKPAADISHLVRKKRKPEEVSPQKNSDAKKPKQEATVNGSDAVHNENGVAKTEKLADKADSEMTEITS